MPTTSDLRLAISGLSLLAKADLRALWRQVDSEAAAREALEDVLPDLARTYRIAAAATAADWYDDLRDELNIDRRFSAIVKDFDDAETGSLARWATEPLRAAEPDWGRARTLVEGGLQLRIANAGRETITESAVADPRARGWQREADGGCPFCVMLASRGAVYSEASVDFAAHDHCQCIAVPAFEGAERLVKPYTPTDRNITDADRARVRAWLRDNDAG